MPKIVLFQSLTLQEQIKALKSVANKTDLTIQNLVTKIIRINPPVSIYTSGNYRICSTFFSNST